MKLSQSQLRRLINEAVKRRFSEVSITESRKMILTKQQLQMMVDEEFDRAMTLRRHLIEGPPFKGMSGGALDYVRENTVDVMRALGEFRQLDAKFPGAFDAAHPPDDVNFETFVEWFRELGFYENGKGQLVSESMSEPMTWDPATSKWVEDEGEDEDY